MASSNYRQNVLSFFRSDTGRLTIIYVGIIMTMSIMFSLVLYNVSVSHLDRRLTPPRQVGIYDNVFGQLRMRDTLQDYFQRNIDKEKAELAWQLVLINVLMLIGGSAVSYFLARQALEPIERAMKSKDQFISDASHELRTPLTALQATNEVALRKKKMTAAESRELIEDNLSEIIRLQQLSNGLLELMKESPKVVRTKTPLQEVVADSFNYVVVKAQQKNITIEDTVPAIWIHTDATMLTQIITILLDNAIKYSDENTVVTVAAKKRKRDVQITVVDQGKGIGLHDLPHVFERFYQADQSRSKQHGSGHGLGLAIAQKMAQHVGAKITVASEQGKGSTFAISVPAIRNQ
jgi:two-component system, OmpR family, sensor histidine kinase CiaH